MAMIKCPECSSEVSDSALKCPSCGVQLRKLKRGFFGKLVKWGFIGFNILMVIWLFSYWSSLGDYLASTSSSDAEKTGAAIGGTIGTGVLFGIWAFGDFILGLFVLFTRPKS